MEIEAVKKDQAKPGLRFRFGLIFFVLGLICPVFIPLVTATDFPAGWKAGLSGLLALGIPELLWMVAIAVMGKEGFRYICGISFKDDSNIKTIGNRKSEERAPRRP